MTPIKSVLVVGPSFGGVGDVAQKVARELSKRNFDVTRILLDEGAIPAFSAVRAIRSNWKTFKQCDVVHVEIGLTSLATFWFALLAAVLRRDIVIVAHDVPQVTKHPAAGLVLTGPGFRDAFAFKVVARLFDGPARRLLMRRAAAGVVLSSAAKDAWISHGPPIITVIDHGADENLTPDLPPSKGSYVLFAGHFGPNKGIETLFKAWSNIPPVMTLKLAGSPSGRQFVDWYTELRSQASTLTPAPEWFETLDDEQFDAMIASAAVVVLPYITSNPVSGILIRAMKHGRPVVATRVPAALDAIENGQTGILIPPGNEKELASALSTLIQDAQRRDKIGAAARQYAATRFTWERHIEGLLETYQLAVSTKVEPKDTESTNKS